jgi:undecaprenyl-diphosphatase
VEISLNLIAVLMGIVEGLTEFLPVSSTGHLIVFGKWFAFESATDATFEIAIQAGAILAVVLVYWKRFIGLFSFRYSTDRFDGLDGCLRLAIACFPSFLLGFLFHKQIKEFLFSPTVVAVSLIVGGIIFIIFPDSGPNGKDASGKNSIDDVSIKDSFIIGCFQVLALCPGVSRSGATIIGGMLTGLNRATAAQFSFFLAVPTLFAAVGYDLYKNYSALNYTDIELFLIGTVVSFVSALIAIRTFLDLISKYSLSWWGVYRILFGIFILYYFA